MEDASPQNESVQSTSYIAGNDPEHGSLVPSQTRYKDSSMLRLPFLGRVHYVYDVQGFMQIGFIVYYWIYGSSTSLFVILLPMYQDGHVPLLLVLCKLMIFPSQQSLITVCWHSASSGDGIEQNGTEWENLFEGFTSWRPSGLKPHLVAGSITLHGTKMACERSFSLLQFTVVSPFAASSVYFEPTRWIQVEWRKAWPSSTMKVWKDCVNIWSTGKPPN